MLCGLESTDLIKLGSALDLTEGTVGLEGRATRRMELRI